MESLFDVYFRKWCSGANQIAFHDCQKCLQNHVFSRIVYLASTRAPPDISYWLWKYVKLVFLWTRYFGVRFISSSCYDCLVYHSHCMCSYLEMFLYALLLYCVCMAPKATRLSASALQEKYGSMLSQSPYTECTSSYFLHKALHNRKPPIDVSVTLVSLLWNSL